jgi:hypothetical protein
VTKKREEADQESRTGQPGDSAERHSKIIPEGEDKRRAGTGRLKKKEKRKRIGQGCEGEQTR